MWPFKRKACPTDIPEDAFWALQEQVQAHIESLKLIIEDQAIVNTAINRIERKQNRWLDLLNGKDERTRGAPQNPIPALVADGDGQGGLPGDEEE